MAETSSEFESSIALLNFLSSFLALMIRVKERALRV